MISLSDLCNALAALIGSDLPECIAREDYKPDLPAQWRNNPARAFLRLTDIDREKARRSLLGAQR